MKKLSWTSTSRTDVGCVREANEDACLERPDVGLWVVADGMGGHAAGDVASAMIVEGLDAIAPASGLTDFVNQVEAELLRVNDELRDYAERRDTGTIGSTVAVLVARGRHAVCLWAGDSRVYRLRNGILVQVSQDHALVEELVEKGVLSPKQAAAHPQANLVTRAVGATDKLFVDIEILALKPGDIYLLCSDGLDKEVEQAELASTMESLDGSDLSEALVELALSRGSRDNVTAVVVHIHGDSEEDADDDTVPGAAGS